VPGINKLVDIPYNILMNFNDVVGPSTPVEFYDRYPFMSQQNTSPSSFLLPGFDDIKPLKK